MAVVQYLRVGIVTASLPLVVALASGPVAPQLAGSGAHAAAGAVPLAGPAACSRSWSAGSPGSGSGGCAASRPPRSSAR